MSVGEGMIDATTVDAVTIDAFGTLLTLRNPVPLLAAALRERGIARSNNEIAAAFQAEVDYYVPRSHEGRDEATLALLRRDCAEVFLGAARADLDAAEFAPAFVNSLVFEPAADAVEACTALADHGVATAVVSNWDIGLHEHLRRLGFDLLVVTSAEAGAPKPDPAIFRLALDRLGTTPERAVHIGDSPADEEGARAAGMRFYPAPLANAVRALV